MGLPASKSALKKVGERIVAGTATERDIELFKATIAAFDDVRDLVFTRLSSLAYPGELHIKVASRTKTRSTLLDKLEREHGIGLAAIRDIAGVRIVLDGNLGDQDAVVDQVRHLRVFDASDIIDRRSKPVQGYRAVHVVGIVKGLSVEIQVRTRLQHAWASLYERLADLWGREIRYPGATAPDLPAFGENSGLTRQSVVQYMIDLSLQIIGPSEELELTFGRTRAMLESGSTSRSRRVGEDLAELRAVHAANAESHAAVRRRIATGLETMDAIVTFFERQPHS